MQVLLILWDRECQNALLNVIIMCMSILMDTGGQLATQENKMHMFIKNLEPVQIIRMQKISVLLWTLERYQWNLVRFIY